MQIRVHLVQDLARHVHGRTVERPVHTVALAQNVVEVVVAVQAERQLKLAQAQVPVPIPNKLPEKFKFQTILFTI